MVCFFYMLVRSVQTLFSAALAMYQRARKLHELIVRTPSLFLTLANEELEAYLIAINALSLVDEKDAWILVPGVVDSKQPVRTIFVLHQVSLTLSRSYTNGPSFQNTSRKTSFLLESIMRSLCTWRICKKSTPCFQLKQISSHEIRPCYQAQASVIPRTTS